MAATTRVLVGTSKGAFILESNDDRATWSVSGPHCDGAPINHVVADPVSGRLFAGGGGEFLGAGIWRSDDGQKWELALLSNGMFDDFLANDPGFAEIVGHGPRPTAPFNGEMTTVWSLAATGDRVLAGTKPAVLLESRDGGETWQKVDGLNNHPTKESWQPGGAGLVLHTILSDAANPERLWVGISAAGVFASEDGGASWERRNERASNDHTACGHEIGHCVHNMTHAGGSLIYQQNHQGVFRSPDGGHTWEEISEGLPTSYGFPIVVDPHNPQKIWNFPLNGDIRGRFPPDASAAVWHSADGGASWVKQQNGLPTKNCFFTVLRQAMATDKHPEAGVYFGTNTGSVFASFDGGDNWSEIASHLPLIFGVETQVLN